MEIEDHDDPVITTDNETSPEDGFRSTPVLTGEEQVIIAAREEAGGAINTSLGGDDDHCDPDSEEGREKRNRQTEAARNFINTNVQVAEYYHDIIYGMDEQIMSLEEQIQQWTQIEQQAIEILGKELSGDWSMEASEVYDDAVKSTEIADQIGINTTNDDGQTGELQQTADGQYVIYDAYTNTRTPVTSEQNAKIEASGLGDQLPSAERSAEIRKITDQQEKEQAAKLNPELAKIEEAESNTVAAKQKIQGIAEKKQILEENAANGTLTTKADIDKSIADPTQPDAGVENAAASPQNNNDIITGDFTPTASSAADQNLADGSIAANAENVPGVSLAFNNEAAGTAPTPTPAPAQQQPAPAETAPAAPLTI